MRFGPVSAVDERSRHGSKGLSTAHLTVRPSNGKDRANTYSHRHPQLSKGGQLPAQPAVWNDLVLAPPEVMISWLRNIFTARSTDCAGAVPLCREIFAHFPVALFRVR